MLNDDDVSEAVRAAEAELERVQQLSALGLSYEGSRLLLTCVLTEPIPDEPDAIAEVEFRVSVEQADLRHVIIAIAQNHLHADLAARADERPEDLAVLDSRIKILVDRSFEAVPLAAGAELQRRLTAACSGAVNAAMVQMLTDMLAAGDTDHLAGNDRLDFAPYLARLRQRLSDAEKAASKQNTKPFARRGRPPKPTLELLEREAQLIASGLTKTEAREVITSELTAAGEHLYSRGDAVRKRISKAHAKRSRSGK